MKRKYLKARNSGREMDKSLKCGSSKANQERTKILLNTRRTQVTQQNVLVIMENKFKLIFS